MMNVQIDTMPNVILTRVNVKFAIAIINAKNLILTISVYWVNAELETSY
jgi:hypothetical protein